MFAAISDDTIRAMFSTQLSALCKSEMPRYRAMTELVARVNAVVLASQPKLAMHYASNSAGLDIERHGAIRVGTAAELALLRRLFAVMGMAPVGYYDLSVAGLPSILRLSGPRRTPRFGAVPFAFSFPCCGWT